MSDQAQVFMGGALGRSWFSEKGIPTHGFSGLLSSRKWDQRHVRTLTERLRKLKNPNGSWMTSGEQLMNRSYCNNGTLC